jgi:hypothetical protein
MYNLSYWSPIFATNIPRWFANNGIVKITGHKTEKAFMKYVKVGKVDAAKRPSEYIKKRWEEKRLKANESLLRVALLPEVNMGKELKHEDNDNKSSNKG